MTTKPELTPQPPLHYAERLHAFICMEPGAPTSAVASAYLAALVDFIDTAKIILTHSSDCSCATFSDGKPYKCHRCEWLRRIEEARRG